MFLLRYNCYIKRIICLDNVSRTMSQCLNKNMFYFHNGFIWGFKDLVRTHFLNSILMTLTQCYLFLSDKSESSVFSPPYNHIFSSSTSTPSSPDLPTLWPHCSISSDSCPSPSPYPPYRPHVQPWLCHLPYSLFLEIKDEKCVDMDFQEYIFCRCQKGRGWKEGCSTSRTQVIVENSVNRNRKQLFISNSGKTVVTGRTFQKTVRPNVFTGCESFTKCWNLGQLFHEIP